MSDSKDKQCYRKPYYEYISETERALRTINNLFGSNPWHEHQKIVGYLEGYIAGMKRMEHEMEAQNFKLSEQE